MRAIIKRPERSECEFTGFGSLEIIHTGGNTINILMDGELIMVDKCKELGILLIPEQQVVSEETMDKTMTHEEIVKRTQEDQKLINKEKLKLTEDDRLDKIINLLESINNNIDRIDNKYVRNR